MSQRKIHDIVWSMNPSSFDRNFPLSENDFDILYDESISKFGSIATTAIAHKQRFRVEKGARFLAKHFPRYWMHIDEEEINFRRKDKTPDRILLLRTGNFDIIEYRYERGLVLAFCVSHIELADITSFFWNQIVTELNNNDRQLDYAIRVRAESKLNARTCAINLL